MFSGLGSLIYSNSNSKIRASYPSLEEFHVAYCNVDQNFFRKDKRELIMDFDRAPPAYVVRIHSRFNLADFYDSRALLDSKESLDRSTSSLPTNARAAVSALYCKEDKEENKIDTKNTGAEALRKKIVVHSKKKEEKGSVAPTYKGLVSPSQILMADLE